MDSILHQSVWNNCLQIIRDNIPVQAFKTWFVPIVPLKIENCVLTIQVPSKFFYEYIEEQYLDLLKKILRKELGKDAKLEYSIVMDSINENNAKPLTIKMPGGNHTDVRNKPVNVPLDMENGSIKNPFVIPGIKKLNIESHLNTTYSFNNFVEGECNRLARSAGYAVANNPGGTAFNPLFIYSENGLGKSHLVQAIGIETKERFPDKTVLYVNANRFQQQFVDSIVKNTSNDFLHFYQLIDVLIIDDIHEFAGKEKTQDVFFHIFNHLHQSNKQLILTSDKPPVEMQGLTQRLLTRFKWGLSADLQLPDFETRVAILRKKIYNDGIIIPDDVIEYIASNVTSNVREMEGFLISLIAQSTLNKKDITLDLAKEIIDKLIKTNKREISIDYIQKVVCNFFGISMDLLADNTRKREIVQARQISMYFAKTLTKSSLATIGSQIGNKDHATVLHACKTVNNLIDTDKTFKQQVDEIEKKLKI